MTDNNEAPSPAPTSKKKPSPTQRLVTYAITAVLMFWLFGKLFPSTPELGSGAPNTTQTQGTTGNLPPADTRKPVSFIGQGGLEENTAPQKMSGTYNVVWRTNGPCSYFADLNGNDVFTASSQTHGTNYIYDLTPDLYHMHMTTGPAGECTWSAKFYPVK